MTWVTYLVRAGAYHLIDMRFRDASSYCLIQYFYYYYAGLQIHPRKID